jgi:hypothetical protein
MITSTQLMIAVAAGLALAFAFRLYRASRNPKPIGKHDALIKRAELHAQHNAFLRKTCRDYRTTGRLSDRQVEAVEKALRGAEATPRKR